jgi:2-polyprenyl-6-methoxyphenol hydroxylase-like FAD-dependent oxidoreductase
MNGEPPSEVDVLVVGAGPTGMVLAAELIRRGVHVQVIDRASTYPTSTRGHALQPRTLEVLDLMGIAPQMLAVGTTTLVTTFYRDGSPILDLDSSIGPRPDAPYRSILVTRQPRIEAVLRDHLRNHGGTIEQGRTLTRIEQDGDGVTATVTDPGGGAPGTVRAAHLVGCDGGHSTVRGLLGVPFEGQTAPEHFALFDAELDWDLDPAPDRVHWFLHDDGMLMASTFGNGPSWNVFAQLPPAPQGQTPPAATPELLARLITERTGRTGTGVRAVSWTSNYTINRRIAGRYRCDRVFLAGDAAHVHSPAGGQGMNTGIQDAFNLGWKLALTVQHRACDALLDTYPQERAPIARALLDSTSDHDSILFSHNIFSTFAREHLAGPLLRRPAVREAVFGRLAQLDVNYRGSSLSCGAPAGEPDGPSVPGVRLEDWLAFQSGPQPGDRAPDAPIDRADTGKPSTLFEQFRSGRFTLLLFTGPEIAQMDRMHGIGAEVSAQFPDLVTVRVVAPGSDQVAGRHATGSGNLLIDADGSARHTYAAHRPTTYLIRPDGHVAHRSQTPDAGRIRAYLAAVLTGSVDAPPTGAGTGRAPDRSAP